MSIRDEEYLVESLRDSDEANPRTDYRTSNQSTTNWTYHKQDDLIQMVSEIRDMMRFFYILGIISLIGSALYLIVSLAGLAG